MRILLLLILIFAGCSLHSQELSEEEIEYNKIYNERIQLSRIDGVYIPENLDDAFEELKRLSGPQSLMKFQKAEEAVVAAKLKGGLGRWMIINWGFYQGSRLSHHIKTLGVHHPEDMSQFMLVSFHRHLNESALNVEEQALYYQTMRKARYEAKVKRDTFIVPQ